MPEMDDLSPPRSQVDPAQIQRNVLEEQVELWWFREPRKSILCYCTSLVLILGCGIGGVALLSTTTSLSSEWRLGVGMALCLLALAVLLKQLLSSAIQDMNCVRSRQRIEMLKSGGFSDLLVILLTGLALVICGIVLLNLALASGMPRPGLTLNDMFISGVVLAAAGCVTVLSLAGYCIVVFILNRTDAGQRLRDRGVRIFTISGQMRETTSSMANLI
ncbi:transmembrane protein 125 [Lepisosteus oculatus]|uniref:Transmembrane protein 125b n=1 Tax=Lepisosteus oculatus TaxID=7918 RepID=W5NMI4_LEPOC|nr:PREDICTED: transmembrane protein 125 [Lepisosteus oculatus]XP_015211137.1 PREDICTED: transmembrane protein 125 [Lepisosteus oculatus]